MQIRLKSSKLELTEAIKKYVQDKMDTVDKHLGHIRVINCDVEVGKSIGSQNKGEIFRAEVNLEVPRRILRIEKTEKDLYKAIDKVKDHLVLQIKKYKEKLIERKRRGKQAE